MKSNRKLRRTKSIAWYKAEIRRIDQRILDRLDRRNTIYHNWMKFWGLE